MSAEAALSCFHCGEPVPPEVELTVTIDGVDQPMCCPGCRAVASLISGSGLESFYRQRTAFNATAEAAAATVDFAMYDLAENQQAFVEELDGGAQRARLLLGGISCAACTWLIETMLEREAGIISANVNLSQQSLLVDWDASQLPLSRIFERLTGLGYEPHPWQAHKGAELLQDEQRSALRQMAVAGLAMMQVGMFGIALHAGDLVSLSMY